MDSDVFRGKDFAHADWLQRRWGGSVDCSDWPRANCAVDFSHGEVVISYIRQMLWDNPLIDAAPVTGSLACSALSDCLLVFCTAGFSSTWTFCSTDFVFSAGFVFDVRRVDDRKNMAADSAALAEARDGITFGVELYVPWDAPEAVMDSSVVVKGQRSVVCFRAGTFAVCESWFRTVVE